MRPEPDKHKASAPRHRAGGYPSFVPPAKNFSGSFDTEGAMQTTQETKLKTTTTTKTKGRKSPKELAHRVADLLCRKVMQLKATLQKRACCIQWLYDCPFHGITGVLRARMLSARLATLRLRLAAMLNALATYERTVA